MPHRPRGQGPVTVIRNGGEFAAACATASLAWSRPGPPAEADAAIGTNVAVNAAILPRRSLSSRSRRPRPRRRLLLRPIKEIGILL